MEPNDEVMVADVPGVELAEDDFDLDVRITVAPEAGEINMDGYTTYTTCHHSCAAVESQIRRDGPQMDGYTTYTTCHCC